MTNPFALTPEEKALIRSIQVGDMLTGGELTQHHRHGCRYVVKEVSFVNRKRTFTVANLLDDDTEGVIETQLTTKHFTADGARYVWRSGVYIGHFFEKYW